MFIEAESMRSVLDQKLVEDEWEDEYEDEYADEIEEAFEERELKRLERKAAANEEIRELVADHEEKVAAAEAAEAAEKEKA